MVGRSLSTNPKLNGRIETPDTFELITKIASTQDTGSRLLNFLRTQLLIYRLKKHLKNSELSILEKSHPSIWIASELLKNISYSKMVLVYRDLLPTVSSMLNHKGVLKWYGSLPQNKENRFLGIDTQNKINFKDLRLEEKCAHRWRSHIIQINDLCQRYPERVLAINYEKFLLNQEECLKDLALFLNIENTFSSELPLLESLDKWKSNLSSQQVELLSNLPFFNLIKELNLE